MKAKRFIVLFFGLGLFILPSLSAADLDQKKSSGKEIVAAEKTPPATNDFKAEFKIDPAITPSEREIIRTYVEQRGEKPEQRAKRLAPGLAKSVAREKNLPPGWEKELARGRIMSENLWKESYPLPKEITVKLPPPLPGTLLVALHGKVVRLLEKNREVVDTFDVSR